LAEKAIRGPNLAPAGISLTSKTTKTRYVGRVFLLLYVVFAVMGSLNLFGTGQGLFAGIAVACIGIWASHRVQEFVSGGEMGEKLEEGRWEVLTIRSGLERLEGRLEDLVKTAIRGILRATKCNNCST
jgi:hypothetical protein